jgi:hypothetical protein
MGTPQPLDIGKPSLLLSANPPCRERKSARSRHFDEAPSISRHSMNPVTVQLPPPWFEPKLF